MEDKIEFEIADTNIKCECGYEDVESSWKDPLNVFKKWEGKKCPKCGKTMLSKEDVDKLKAVLSTIEFANMQ
jgi:Zn finger protein HypA/HybF involved in hydrogenase expression